jgi:menaquinone-dependent protoporphyrinogen oxidase
MRVLVTWGSKRGGTEGIARIIGETLEARGLDVDLLPARRALRASGFDAVIVGGALYGNRWHRDARRFVNRRARELAHVPVWFFSSGPLDDSAARDVIEPTRQVETLMQRVGARGHETFGGRLEADAQGFPVAAMAKEHAGDWRDPDRIRSWAVWLAEALPTASPGLLIEQRGGSLARLFGFGVIGWALCAAVMALLLAITSTAAAVVAHAVLAPMIFATVASRYFHPRGARDPLPTAFAFTATVAVLDTVVVALLFQRSLALLASFGGFWLPLALIFAATLATGVIMSTLPWPKPTEHAHGHGH